VAITIALVASLETLLSLEAVDRLDPMHRHSQPNREMLAQGAGNLLNGLLGGMPITAVIVRSAANIEAGGRSRLPALLHGVLLAVSIIALPRLLQVMPLAALAVVLLSVGYKLASLPLFRQMLTLGPRQYLPFFVTVGAILLTDLLVGIGIGLAVSVALVLKTHYDQGLVLEPRPDATGRPIYRLELPAHLSFFHKASLRGLLRSLPDHVSLAVDGSEVAHWDADILETLLEFRDNARHRGIEVTLLGLPDNPPVVSAH
jgi:MFS superfamily sulfate permease-like transporter